MRIAVVTGARGLGFEVGRGLAAAGYHVIFGVRNGETGNNAAAQIRSELPDAVVDHELLDLANLKSIAAFCDRLGSTYSQIDVAVNNAGVIMPLEREVTADGFEMQFGTNHLGHFALIGGLFPLLRAGDNPRVVGVGSLAHKRGEIDFADLQWERTTYKRTPAYARSKLANLLFIQELQRRSIAGGWGLTTVAAHPGFARTEALVRSDDSALKTVLSKYTGYLIPPASKAARSIVFAATSPDIAPAGFYGPSGPGEIAGKVGPAKLGAKVYDAATASRLWDVSETLTGVTFPAAG